MRTRRILVLFSIAVIAVSALAACGGGSKSVPANAIAVVGNQVVLRSQYDELLAESKAGYVNANKKFPAVGSSAYETIRNQIVTYLVQAAAIDHQAANMGIKVTDAEVNADLQSIIKDRFKGNRAKYEAQLRKEGLTEARLKDGIRKNLLSQRVQQALIATVQVSDSDVKTYYEDHLSSYKVGESRAASHILVKSKALADQIYKQLKAGADFSALAKKYSTDTATKTKGGSLGDMQKSQLVEPFAKSLFALDTGAFSAPVKTIYGWHIIRADGPVKAAHTQTLKEADATIRQTLLSEKQNQAITDWVNDAHKYAADHAAYAPGFEPPKQTTGTSTVATATTG
jgi:foldase protein PrsA